MAAAFVQSNVNSDFTAAFFGTFSVTLGATVGSGNAVCISVSFNNTTGATIVSVTDDKGNTYTQANIVTDATFGQTAATYYLGNITNAPITFTVTFSVSTPIVEITACEYSGIAALANPTDGNTVQQQASPGTGTDAISSGNITTGSNGDIIWGCFQARFFPSGTITAGTSFTARTRDSVDFMVTEDRVQSSAGAIAATFTQSLNGATAAFVIALKPPAAGAALFMNSNLDGLGAGGSFFRDPLGA